VTTILTALARQLGHTALSILGHLLLDIFKSWQAAGDARARGRAEAMRDMTADAIRVEQGMADIALPERDEFLRRLREGTA
jgi:hypothetical protein